MKRMLDDAMNPRRISARWVVRGILTLQSAMHLGGEPGERVDMPILRDPLKGYPLLLGSTFAGALRSALTDHLEGYRQEESDAVGALFGARRSDEESGSQSPLIVFDSIGKLPPTGGIEIRDGVAISLESGVAEECKKFDFEILPAGTQFPVRLDLLVPAEENSCKALGGEKSLLERLIVALEAFSHGENAFGARRSRGLGRVEARWAAKRFTLDTEAGWLEWILSKHEDPLAAEPQACIQAAIEAQAPESLKPFVLPHDRRSKVTIDLDARVVHDILVRSPGSEPGSPDVSHLRSSGQPILPGTSLAGVMRAQAYRIAELFHGPSDAKEWVEQIFGPRFEGTHPPPGYMLHASRLRVSEAKIEGSHALPQTRVAIDRFTQAPVDGALFDEQVEVGGKIQIRLTLENPRAGELGLILLVVKDLLDGTLPVGGTSSVGRGELRGHAVIIWPEEQGGSGKPTRSARVEPGKSPSGEAAADVMAEIRSFHISKPKPTGSRDVRRTMESV